MLLYLPAIRSGFIWDDDFYVYSNPTLESSGALQRIWTDPSASPQYYPLVFTTFLIERQLWGENPLGYHLVNALVHGLSAWLLWRLLRRLQVPGALLAATFFAFHPVQVESVAWVTERKNILSALCYLGAAILLLRFLRPLAGEARRPVHYVGALILFLAALWAKTTAATLPAAILLVLWWKERRLTRRHLLAVLPLFALGIGLGLHTAWLERHHVGAAGFEWDLTPLDRFVIAGRAIVFYLQKLVLPVRLTFIYPRWETGAASVWQIGYLLGFGLLLVALFVGRRRLGTGPLTALLFFAGTLFPALGFFDVYPMRYSFVADHFQYLATIGPLALLAAVVTTGFERWRPSGSERTRIVAGGLILAALGVLTWQQQRDYRDADTLWTRTLQKNPRAWMAHVNLGSLAVERKEYDRALAHFDRAMEIRPEEHNAYFNTGSVLVTLRRHGEAIPYLQKATELHPRHPEAQYLLGLAQLRVNRPGAAVAPLEAAIRARADWVDPTNALAWIRTVYPDSAFHDPAAGVRLAETANRLAGTDDPHLLDTLAAAYAAAGRFGDAGSALARARVQLQAAGDASSLADLEEKSVLYASGRAYREDAR